MHYLLEKLTHDERHRAVEWVAAAVEKWKELLGDPPHVLDVDALAHNLNLLQLAYFEQRCGGRYIGQEIMAWTPFALLYSTTVGFEDNREVARRVHVAFKQSMCSLEVKVHADRAAKSYSVNED